jgi:hypothetical protein
MSAKDGLIFYVVNLHDWKSTEVHSFGTLRKASKFADKKSEETGCTFAVMEGVEWHQGECFKCPHTRGLGTRRCKKAHKAD